MRRTALLVLLVPVVLLVLGGCDDGGGEPAPARDGGVGDLGLDAAADAGADALPEDARVLPDLRVPGDGGLEPDGPPGIRHVWVGVNEIPENMLGFEPVTHEGARRDFHWTLPPAGWTVNVVVEHGPDWAPAEPPYVLWRFLSAAGAPIALDPQALDPPGGVWEAIRGGHRWRARVVTPIVADPGRYTLETAVEGNLSRKLTVAIAELTPEVDPFEEVDHWVVTFSRDRGHLEVGFADGRFSVTATNEPDGVPDFVEALEAVALLGGDEAWDAALIAALRARIRSHLYAFFHLDPRTGGSAGEESVRIAFHFEDDPDLPAPETWDELGWSRIAIGGDDPQFQPGGRTFFGRAAIDWNNARPDENTTPDRGVFTTSLVRFVLANAFTSTILRDYVAASGGRPFGSVAGDEAFLQPGFDADALPAGETKSRALRFRLLFDALSLALASITAHEMGHSLGLVKPGLPPQGLLAEVDGPWVARPVEDAHIDTPGFNLMQSGSSFDFADALNASPSFNEVNLAYLRRRLLVLP